MQLYFENVALVRDGFSYRAPLQSHQYEMDVLLVEIVAHTIRMLSDIVLFFRW